MHSRPRLQRRESRRASVANPLPIRLQQRLQRLIIFLCGTQGILCDTRWSYAWAHPQIIGPSDFGRQGRHVGWKLVPPGDPPPEIVGLSSLLNLPGSTGDGECAWQDVHACTAQTGGGSERLDVHATCQSGDAGSSMLLVHGIAIGSVGMFLVLYLGGVIGGAGAGGHGKGGKTGRYTDAAAIVYRRKSRSLKAGE